MRCARCGIALGVLGAFVGCFEPRVDVRPDGEPPADAATAAMDAAPLPEPIDCDGLARQVNERPDELPAGACRPAAAPCEWRNVCVGGVEATLRCACGADDGGARWRCAASGDAPCRSAAEAGVDVPPSNPLDIVSIDVGDGSSRHFVDCYELQAMFLSDRAVRPGGACQQDGASCEWPRYCLRGYVTNITCRCRAVPPIDGLEWGCDGFSFGQTCGDGPDARVDVAPE